MAVSPRPKRGFQSWQDQARERNQDHGVADSHGLPVGLSIESASPHEVKLVESTLIDMVIAEAPQNLVGDNAYDSDRLDAELRQRNRINRTPPFQP